MANCDLSCRGFPVLDVEGLDLPPPVLVLRSREFEPLSVDLFSETRLHPFVLVFSSGSSTTESLCSGCLSCPSVKSGRCVCGCAHTILQHFSTAWHQIETLCFLSACVCVCVQVLMCGCSYMVLFMGNFFTTLAVVYQKYRNNQGKSKSL